SLQLPGGIPDGATTNKPAATGRPTATRLSPPNFLEAATEKESWGVLSRRSAAVPAQSAREFGSALSSESWGEVAAQGAPDAATEGGARPRTQSERHASIRRRDSAARSARKGERNAGGGASHVPGTCRAPYAVTAYSRSQWRGEYTFVSTGSDAVCALYVIADPEYVVEFETLRFDVSCTKGGLLTVSPVA
ncbi:hypothetical protein MRX96_049064, partial [Rhipicephalus microplus]